MIQLDRFTVRTRALCRAVAAGALLLATSTGVLPGEADAANQGFVRAEGGQFVLNGAPFRFVGTNAYFMLDAATDGSTAHTTEMMSLANALGFTVFRTWGFLDGTSAGTALQPAAGVYNESAFQKLDWVLAQADGAGVRLIVTLVNYWGDYGGMPQYVTWCAPGSSVDAFYTNATCRQLYKNYVSYMLNRVNTYNGRLYKDDPTVFSWELANEPRSGDPSGTVVLNWVREMAAYIKSIDSNHMVDVGDEGFDTTTAGYSPLSTYNNQGWLFNGGVGVAFTANTADPNVDFGSTHLYPEYWNFSTAAGSAWIADHIRIARQLGKPLVVGEFGYSQSPAAVFDAWLQTFNTEQGGGAQVWQLICQSCQNYAGFSTVYPPSTAVSDVLAQAAAVANTGGSPPPPPPPAVEPVFTVGTTTVGPNPVRRNQTLGIDTVVSVDVAATGIIVDLEIYNAAGTKVAQQVDGGLSFAAGETRAFHWNWRANVAVGTYTVKVGVFSANWATLYTWANQAATFTVVRR